MVSLLVAASLLAVVPAGVPVGAQSPGWTVNDNPSLHGRWLAGDAASKGYGYGPGRYWGQSNYSYVSAADGRDPSGAYAVWEMGRRDGAWEIEAFIPSNHSTASVRYEVCVAAGCEHTGWVHQLDLAGWTPLGTWEAGGAEVKVKVSWSDSKIAAGRTDPYWQGVGVDAVRMRPAFARGTASPDAQTPGASQSVASGLPGKPTGLSLRLADGAADPAEHAFIAAWSSPHSGGGSVQHWVVTVSAPSTTTFTKQLDRAQRSLTITGQRCLTYTVRVAAKNQHGSGPAATKQITLATSSCSVSGLVSQSVDIPLGDVPLHIFVGTPETDDVLYVSDQISAWGGRHRYVCGIAASGKKALEDPHFKRGIYDFAVPRDGRYELYAYYPGSKEGKDIRNDGSTSIKAEVTNKDGTVSHSRSFVHEDQFGGWRRLGFSGQWFDGFAGRKARQVHKLKKGDTLRITISNGGLENPHMKNGNSIESCGSDNRVVFPPLLLARISSLDGEPTEFVPYDPVRDLNPYAAALVSACLRRKTLHHTTRDDSWSPADTILLVAAILGALSLIPGLGILQVGDFTTGSFLPGNIGAWRNYSVDITKRRPEWESCIGSLDRGVQFFIPDMGYWISEPSYLTSTLQTSLREITNARNLSPSLWPFSSSNGIRLAVAVPAGTHRDGVLSCTDNVNKYKLQLFESDARCSTFFHTTEGHFGIFMTH